MYYPSRPCSATAVRGLAAERGRVDFRSPRTETTTNCYNSKRNTETHITLELDQS